MHEEIMNEVPKLSYVALITRDVPAAAKVLGVVLGLTQSDCMIEGGGSVPVFAVGNAALALCRPGDSLVDGEERPGVHHIGLTVGDIAGTAERLRSAGIGISDAAPGLEAHRRMALDPKNTVGVRTFLVEPLNISRSSSSRIERIDHLGIASASTQEAIAAFTGKIGLPTESQQTDMEVETAIESFTSDKYGVVYHGRKPRIVGGLRVAFLTTGDCELEFLQNFDASHGAEISHGASGNTRQDQGAITKYIATRGQGLHHVALKSPDIDATLAAMAEAGCTMIDKKGRPGSRRALIGFIHPKTFGGVLFHVVQRD
jgi:catechol 2,3-dioxygenase-like lactoylglutathione lyase family enzyme